MVKLALPIFDFPSLCNRYIFVRPVARQHYVLHLKLQQYLSYCLIEISGLISMLLSLFKNLRKYL